MNEHDLTILAKTIYGEARGEYETYGPGALIAVANVIINRFKRGETFGKTIADVCLKPKQFSCWNEKDPNRTLLESQATLKEPLFLLCKEVGEKVGEGIWPDLTRGCDHYHAVSCHPAWAKVEKIKLRLGHHIFYKLTEVRL
jgi:spore germination cell wall hydrolase CwlJ-like protein